MYNFLESAWLEMQKNLSYATKFTFFTWKYSQLQNGEVRKSQLQNGKVRKISDLCSEKNDTWPEMQKNQISTIKQSQLQNGEVKKF